MSDTDEALSDIGYIRGGGGVAGDPRRIGRILVATLAIALGALAVTLTVTAVRDNARMHGLQTQGVATTVTVTSCLALASGTGITEAGFTCTGAYQVAGREYTSVIGGLDQQLSPGTELSGVANAQDPRVLSTAQAVANAPTYWHAFIAAAVTAAGLLLLVCTAALLSRRAHPRS